MCKYCEGFQDDGLNNRGEYLADSGYEECYIALIEDKFYIHITGSNSQTGVEISTCPVCGRNLKEASQ